jgi:hypothetical protein
MILRHVGPVQSDPAKAMAAAGTVFQVIAMAKTSTSAADAKAIGYLRSSDGVTMNRDRLLADAKAKALSLVPGYTAPTARSVTLSGARGKSMLLAGVAALAAAGKVTAHDQVVTEHLASVLTGGDTDGATAIGEQALLDLERAHSCNWHAHPARWRGSSTCSPPASLCGIEELTDADVQGSAGRHQVRPHRRDRLRTTHCAPRLCRLRYRHGDVGARRRGAVLRRGAAADQPER